MSGTIQRINPRRPFRVTAEGLKRIVLGEMGQGGAFHVAQHREAAPKPMRLNGQPTGHLLVIAHADRGALDAQAHQAIAAAALLADPHTAVAVLVLGELTEDLGPLGADHVHIAAACDKSRFDPARELALATALITRLQPRHILLSDTMPAGADLGRRLAAQLGDSAASHVAELRPDAVAAYWQGGATMARRTLPRLLLLDADTTDTALPFRGNGEVSPLDLPPLADTPYTDLGTPPVDATQLGLEEADFIVAAGNGVTDVPTVLALAKTFDAAIGASRVAVDDGRFTRDKQVGATGKTVSANVYMAIGISGAVQHLQGIKAVRHVIAINTDASAPIAGRADLTVVDDAQAVMAELLAATSNRNFPAGAIAPHPPTGPSPYQGEARRGHAHPDIGVSPPNLPLTGGGTDRGASTSLTPKRPVDTLPLVGRDQGWGSASPNAPTRIAVLASLGRNPITGTARPNRDDLLALDLAHGLGAVSVLHAGNPDEPALADYLAYGAQTIDVVPANDIATALAAHAGNHDLILTGTSAEGGEGSGLVPYLVAQQLGWPIVTQAIAVTIADGHADITQALPKGQRRHIRVQLPAVIAVDPRAPFKPRYAHARRVAGQVVPREVSAPTPAENPWRVEPASKRPVKFKAREQKAGHARMLSAIVTEARGGAVLTTGSAADKAQAILSYLRTNKLIDW